MKKLKNNKELYNYLKILVLELKHRKADDLSDMVEHACKAASTLSPTIFLGETRRMLQQVLVQENGKLLPQERTSISEVLKEIQDSFARHKAETLDSYKKYAPPPE